MNEAENIFVILGILFVFIGIPTICLCNCSGEKNKIINIYANSIPSSKIPLLIEPVNTNNKNNKYIEI